MNRLLAVAVSLLAAPVSGLSDTVVPVDGVEDHVNVRMEADAASEIVGVLRKGDGLPHEGTVDGWHKVLLLDDAYGFVHGDWGVVISDDEFAARKSAAAKAAEAEQVARPGAAPPPKAGAPEARDVVATDSVAAGIAQPAAAGDPAMAAPITTEGAAGSAPPTADSVVEPEAPLEIAADVAPAAPQDEPQPAASPAEATVAQPVPALVTTVQGPPGPPGPAGPPGRSAVEGTVDYLVKFTERAVGGNSQVYDNGQNVGIGTDEPEQRLEVNGNIRINERNSNVAALMLTQASGDTGYIMHNRANTLTIGAGSVDRVTIDRDGNVGIGIARPEHPLEMASGAYVSAGGVWTNSSSRSRKQDIAELETADAVAALEALQPVRFRYRDDASEEYLGFIAEDVPDLVASADRQSLSSMDVVAVLTKVVQRQQQQIDALEAELRKLAR